MRAFLTTCSAEKRRDARPLPAVERYTHPRVHAAALEAQEAVAPLFILSGRFGLIDARAPIPWYDHALQPHEVATLWPRVAARMRTRGISTLELRMLPPETPGWAPYHAVIEQAAAAAGVRLRRGWLTGS